MLETPDKLLRIRIGLGNAGHLQGTHAFGSSVAESLTGHRSMSMREISKFGNQSYETQGPCDYDKTPEMCPLVGAGLTKMLMDASECFSVVCANHLFGAPCVLPCLS